jgi:hypothetical protein
MMLKNHLYLRTYLPARVNSPLYFFDGPGAAEGHGYCAVDLLACQMGAACFQAQWLYHPTRAVSVHHSSEAIFVLVI